MIIRKKSKIIFRGIEIADSYSRKVKGLSGRKEMGCGGMLFIFSYQGKHGIWMPGMKFPIDIVYMDDDKKVVDIKHCAKPLSLHPKTWKVFRPKQKSRYVLEVPANAALRKISIGDILQFDIPESGE